MVSHKRFSKKIWLDAIISFIFLPVYLVTVAVKCKQFGHVYVVTKSPRNIVAICDAGHSYTYARTALS